MRECSGRSTRTGFSGWNADAVAQVCHRLDGMPLSIELAAARLNMLSIDQIAARLDHSFRLLTGGNRTAVRRQQTLRATIDWSYQLLSERERSLVRKLAVFAGGWCLEAAEALGAEAAQPEEDVFELLGHMVAKSMVVVDEPRETSPTMVRYRFLETIRQYLEEKLVEAGEADLARTRHRDWYLNFAEQAMAGWREPIKSCGRIDWTSSLTTSGWP
jgi:predicted ATPase